MGIDTRAIATAVSTAVRHDDDLTCLAQIRAAQEELACMERTWVDRARRSGLSWSQIGDALGTTKQAVQQRYRNLSL
jgi:hypothetical protein